MCSQRHVPHKLCMLPKGRSQLIQERFQLRSLGCCHFLAQFPNSFVDWVNFQEPISVWGRGRLKTRRLQLQYRNHCSVRFTAPGMAVLRSANNPVHPQRRPVAKRILIADDHESVLRGLRIMLEAHANWTVCGEAVNGYEAIAKAVELRPDLIVLDFAMPYLDGLQTADEISKLLPGVQIVLHTIHGADVVLEANRHGISRVVQKAKSGALVSAVAELLNPERRF